MPRHNSVRRENGKVVIVLSSVQHTLTVPAFLELIRLLWPVYVSINEEGQEGQETDVK